MKPAALLLTHSLSPPPFPLVALVVLHLLLHPLVAQDQLVRTTDPKSPAEEQAALTVPPGFEIQLFAAEPRINKPINLAHDTHSANWGNVRSWTGILAPGLSRRAVWAALESRHCYSTLDRNCRLDFTVCGAVMGEVVAEPVESVEVKVVVEDPDQADKVAKIELYEDGEVVQTHEPADGEGQWSVKHKAAPGSRHYFVKVTQADGDMLWSAPVWLAVVSWK